MLVINFSFTPWVDIGTMQPMAETGQPTFREYLGD